MTEIKVEIDIEMNLTIFTVEGEITIAELIKYSSRYYNYGATKHALWDFTLGTARNITRDDLIILANQMTEYLSVRKGGRTALVSQKDLDFGLGRMYEAQSEYENLPISYRTFRNVNSAREWLFARE